MTVFSIFSAIEPTPGDAEPRAVAEKFSWFAALLPPVFLAVHGIWRHLLLFIVVAIALIALSGFVGGTAAFWLYVLYAVWLGFDAPALRRAALRRQGFAYQTDVIAGAADMAKVEWLKNFRKALP